MRVSVGYFGICLALASVPAQAADQYFVGHMGAETCVPLNDVTSDFRRVYYGGGDLHTPGDYEAGLRSVGLSVTRVALQTDLNVIAYMATATPPPGVSGKPKKALMLLFTDEGDCQLFMAAQRP